MATYLNRKVAGVFDPIASWPNGPTGQKYYWSPINGEPDTGNQQATSTLGWIMQPYIMPARGTVEGYAMWPQSNGASTADRVGWAIWDGDTKKLLHSGTTSITAGTNLLIADFTLSNAVPERILFGVVGALASTGAATAIQMQATKPAGPLPGMMGLLNATQRRNIVPWFHQEIPPTYDDPPSTVTPIEAVSLGASLPFSLAVFWE